MIYFSLILPVYNLERYIGKCVLSCIMQQCFSPKDYEIIIVDDGSEDNSINIAKQTAARYPQYDIKFITRRNGGLSAARNTGLQHATGKYVWFIDADDYIRGDALKILYDKLQEIGDINILRFSHQTIYGDAKSTPPRLTERLVSGYDIISETGFLSAWTNIYRLDFLRNNDLTFKEGVIWEDAEFNIRAYGICERVYEYTIVLYYYIRREGSISSGKANRRSLASSLSNIKSIQEFFRHVHLSRKQRKILNKRLAMIFISVIAGLKDLPKDDRENIKAEIRAEKQMYERLFSCSGNFEVKAVGLMIFHIPRIAECVLAYMMRRAIGRRR